MGGIYPERVLLGRLIGDFVVVWGAQIPPVSRDVSRWIWALPSSEPTEEGACTHRPPAGRVRSPPLTPALWEIRAPVPPWRGRCRGGVNGAPNRVREGPCSPVLLLMGGPL